MLIVKKYTLITPKEFIYNFYYSVLIFIELYFSNFRLLVSVWQYQMLYNTIWAPDDEHNSAWNM